MIGFLKSFFTKSDDDNPNKNRFLFVLFFFLVMFLLWSTLFKVEQVVGGEAKVVSNTKLQSVQHMEGGIVANIHVKSGDAVAQGQHLITLSGIQSDVDYQSNRAEYLAALAKLTRLEAEFQQTDIVRFSKELIEEAPDIVSTERQQFLSKNNEFQATLSSLESKLLQKKSQFDALEYEYFSALGKLTRLTAESKKLNKITFPNELIRQTPEIVSNESQQFISRNKKIKSTMLSLNSKLNQKNSRVKILKIEEQKNLELAYVAEQEYKVVMRLVKKGLESKLEGLRSRRALKEAFSKRDSISYEIKRLEDEIKETQFRMDSVEEDHLSSILEEISISTGTVQSLSEDLKRLKDEINDIEFQTTSTNERHKTGILEEISTARSRLQALKQGLRGSADTLDRTIIKSPINGTINQLHASTIGGVIRAGEVIVEIVPMGSSLMIDAKINPSDIGFVIKGMRARIKLSAYDYAIFGDLEGEVSQVSADTIADEQGSIFYRVQIKPDTDSINWKNQQLPMLIGMTGQVDIISSKRTILSYITSPVSRTLATAFREK